MQFKTLAWPLVIKISIIKTLYENRIITVTKQGQETSVSKKWTTSFLDALGKVNFNF